MATLRLTVVAFLCAGLGEMATASHVTDGATVGVLFDSERGLHLADLLVNIVSNVTTVSDWTCELQMSELQATGVHRFVSLCEEGAPAAKDGIVITLRDDCQSGVEGCHSLRLPEGSQWRAVAQFVKQLQLSRVLLADGGEDDSLAEALAEQNVPTLDVTQAGAAAGRRLLADPARSAVVVRSRVGLLSALRRLDNAGIRAEQWFVPGVLAEPLTAEERRLLGEARLYTMQEGVESTAPLPEAPEGWDAASVALALDAVSAARGVASGLTGPLEFDGQRRRVGSSVDILLHRSEGSASVAPRAGEWVPVAGLRGEQLLPPSVQYVLPSVLLPKLSGGADCSGGRLHLAGTDAVAGRRFRRDFPVHEAPRMLLMYGSAPFRLSVQCANVTSELHCGDENPHACVHTQHTFLPAGDSQPALTRARRSASASAYYYPNSEPLREPVRRRFRNGRAQYANSANQVSEFGASKLRSGQFLAGVNRAGGYVAETVPPTVPVLPSVAPTQRQQASENYESHHTGAPFPHHDAPESFPHHDTPEAYQAYTSLAQRPPRPTTSVQIAPPRRRAGHGGNSHGYGGHGHEAEPVLTTRELLRLTLSDIFGCVGSVGGCSLCVQYFDRNFPNTPPESCLAACALGVGGACSGMIGSLLSQLLAA